MKYLTIFFSVAVLFIAGFACNSLVTKHDDDFYNDTGSWDSAKLPLIKPYYLIYIGREYGWQMPLQGSLQNQHYYYTGDLLDIRKIAVESDIIMVYTPYARKLDESLGQKVLHWFIISPKNGNEEIGFENEADFQSHIKEIGINEPTWLDPDIAFSEFTETGCMTWIPDCFSPER